MPRKSQQKIEANSDPKSESKNQHKADKNSNENGLGNFKSTPREIILYILSFLGPKELCTVAELSKAFSSIANDDYLWKWHLLPVFNNTNVDVIADENDFKFQKSETTHRAKTLFKFFSEQSIHGQSRRLKNILFDLQAMELEIGYGVTPHAAEQWQDQIEHAEKKKKRKWFGFIPHGKPQLDEGKLSETVKSIKGLCLPELKKIAEVVHQRKKNSSYANVSHYSGLIALYSTLKKCIDEHGEEAAIVKHPECFEKILHCISGPAALLDNYLHLLAEILAHEKIVRHPELPQIIDNVVTYFQDPKNKMFLTKLVMEGNDGGKLLVHMMLDRVDQRHSKTLTS